MVTFGQKVREVSIGHVHDNLGIDRIPVATDQPGIIFILQSVASVKKGDEVGTIASSE